MAASFPPSATVRSAFAFALACLAAALPLPLRAEAPAESVFRESCPTCGVVRSVTRVDVQAGPSRAERAAATGSAGMDTVGSLPQPGLVSSVPMQGGGGAAVGSATELRRGEQPHAAGYEIVVRLDDGRFQLVRQDDSDGLREGDKVRIEAGRVVRR